MAKRSYSQKMKGTDNKKLKETRARNRNAKQNSETVADDNLEIDGQVVGQPAHHSIDSPRGLSVAEIQAHLKCPVCFDVVSPPVLQCLNGHILCAMCRQSATECPMCRANIRQTIRCLLVEQMAANLQFDCKYNSEGCAVQVKFADKSDHEKSCSFGPHRCPLGFAERCNWSGNLADVCGHIESHGVPTVTVGRDYTWLVDGLSRQPSNHYWACLLVCDSQPFLVVLLKSAVLVQYRYQYYLYVFVVANIDRDERFECTLKINAKGDHWCAKRCVRSIRVSAAEAKRTAFEIDTDMAKLFAGSDDKLVVNVKISPK